jgi:hypothetical protein
MFQTSRQFVNTKESKILRDISASKKLIHDLQLKIEDRKLDMNKLNVRLAQSMSLTSAHGQVHYMRLERDAVIGKESYTIVLFVRRPHSFTTCRGTREIETRISCCFTRV